jgi:hypothetical protein
MKITLLALLTVSMTFTPVVEEENVATMKHVPAPTTRSDIPLMLTFIVTSPHQADVVSGLLWQAGIGPGSHVEYCTAPCAGIIVPDNADLSWARSVLRSAES